MQSVPAPQVDPNLAAQQQQAQRSQIDALQTQAAGDTASLMTRYGTKLALSGAGIPAVAPQAGAALPIAGARAF
jgi:hypothetical protein